MRPIVQIATVSFKRPDLYTIEVHAKNSGQFGDVRGPWKLSADGKTLTITLKGTNAQGPTNRVRAYDKQ